MVALTRLNVMLYVHCLILKMVLCTYHTDWRNS